MADSDSSSLSSAPSTDDEAMELKMSKPTGLNRYFKPAPKEKQATPEPPRRAPSPPHEYTLADNDAIAFLVMFRSRFSDAFPKALPHYGPQDIERGVSGDLPDEGVERYLCALLGLVLNRKKDVERGHYGRALEDAISTNRSQWPTAWSGQNPLRGERSFNNMTPEERLILLRALVLWSLNQSEAVQAIVKESWKQTRRDDDKNQPRSVQPWFSDSYRRRFWLIEGQEDSFFRVYRENDGKTSKTNTWFSVAGTTDEVNALADKFTEENTQNARLNADKLRSAVPRFEQGEEKRKRREYRQQRKAAWTRPAPGFSFYEGRTRGKRARYTFDDEDDFVSDGTRRLTRNATPADSGPVVTASGRQVKSRVGGVYGESLSSDQRHMHDYNSGTGEAEGDDSEDEMPASAPTGRSQRAARARQTPTQVKHYDGADDMDTDSDDQPDEGDEWSGDENEPDDEDESEGDMSEDDELGGGIISDDEGDTQKSLVVALRYGRRIKTPVPPSSRARTPLPVDQNNASTEIPITDGFGGDGTSEALPLQQRSNQQLNTSSEGSALKENSLEPVPSTAITNGNGDQFMVDSHDAMQPAGTTLYRTGDLDSAQSASSTASPGFQQFQPAIAPLKTLTPPSSLPETAKESTGDDVAGAEENQPQQQCRPEGHPMDVL